MRRHWTNDEIEALRRLTPGRTRPEITDAHNRWAIANGYPQRSLSAISSQMAALGIPSGVSRKKAVECIDTGLRFASIADAARQSYVSRQALSNHLNGRFATCGGKRWRFIDA